MVFPLNLLLVRHGESEGNVANRASRKGDHSRFENPKFRNRHSSHWRLSEQGLKDAEWAGEIIRAEHPVIGRKYSSTHLRAMETMGVMRLDGPPTMMSFELRERSWGELDRLTHEERLARYGENLRRQEEDPFLWEPAGGEPLVGAIPRVRDWFNTVWRECGEMDCVVATCHAEVIEVARVVTERILPHEYMAMKKDPTQGIWNCSILQYTRQNPDTMKVEDYFTHVRLRTPPAAHLAGETGFSWKEIKRPLFSDEELLAYVERHAPRIAY